jgi:hypothetical protein
MMTNRLDVKQWLVCIVDTASNYAEPLKANIETYARVKIAFKDNGNLVRHIIAVMIALQLKSVRNIERFNHEQIEAKIQTLLSGCCDSADKVQELIEYYSMIYEMEREKDMRPLSGIAWKFLAAIIDKDNANGALDKQTLSSGHINSVFLLALSSEISKLLAISTALREKYLSIS